MLYKLLPLVSLSAGKQREAGFGGDRNKRAASVAVQACKCEAAHRSEAKCQLKALYLLAAAALASPALTMARLAAYNIGPAIIENREAHVVRELMVIYRNGMPAANVIAEAKSPRSSAKLAAPSRFSARGMASCREEKLSCPKIKVRPAA